MQLQLLVNSIQDYLNPGTQKEKSPKSGDIDPTYGLQIILD